MRKFHVLVRKNNTRKLRKKNPFQAIVFVLIIQCLSLPSWTIMLTLVPILESCSHLEFIQVESIHLPNNGLIVFTDNGANFGDDVHWQCAKDNLEEPKGELIVFDLWTLIGILHFYFKESFPDVFFTRGNGRDISFYNPKNWIPDRRLFLHMKQVQSEVVSSNQKRKIL